MSRPSHTVSAREMYWNAWGGPSRHTIQGQPNPCRFIRFTALRPAARNRFARAGKYELALRICFILRLVLLHS
jgi:hypothetical protein